MHFVKHSLVLKACFEARSVVYNHSNPENLAIQPRKPSSAGYYLYIYIFNMYVLPKTRKKQLGPSVLKQKTWNKNIFSFAEWILFTLDEGYYCWIMDERVQNLWTKILIFKFVIPQIS